MDLVPWMTHRVAFVAFAGCMLERAKMSFAGCAGCMLEVAQLSSAGCMLEIVQPS